MTCCLGVLGASAEIAASAKSLFAGDNLENAGAWIAKDGHSLLPRMLMENATRRGAHGTACVGGHD